MTTGSPHSCTNTISSILQVSISTFFGYDWVMGPGPKIKKSQLWLVPLFRKPHIIVSDSFLTLDLFFSAAPKGWKESIGFPDTEVYDKSFEKKFIKKSNILEARLAVTGEFVFFICFD